MPSEEFAEDVLYVVMIHHLPAAKKTRKVIFTDKNPKETLNLFKEEEFQEACVGSGGKIDTAFLGEGLIDEIYLDVEPTILGKGIQLFFPEDFEVQLELLEINKLNKDTIQLHYLVKKIIYILASIFGFCDNITL